MERSMETHEVPIDQVPLQELELLHHGPTAEKPDAFYATHGDQPLALRLRRVCEKLGRPIAPDFELYEMFEIWLVPHRVSIVRRAGSSEVTRVEMGIEYIHDAGTTCC